MPGDYKETRYRKNQIGILYTGLERTNYKFSFSEIFLKHFLSAYMENTLNGKKVLKLSIAQLVI